MASRYKRIPEVVRYNEVKHLLWEAQEALSCVHKELDESDRRVAKAARLGVSLSSIYPDEASLYEQRVVKVHEYEDKIASYTKEVEDYEEVNGKPITRGEV